MFSAKRSHMQLDIKTLKKSLIYKQLSELLTIKYFQKLFNYY